MGYERIK